LVIPHGYHPDLFKDKSKIDLSVKRSFKFLNVSIGHYRKNIGLLVDAYYSAFTKDDDVSLVESLVAIDLLELLLPLVSPKPIQLAGSFLLLSENAVLGEFL